MQADMVEPLREIRDGYLMSLNLGTPAQVIQVYLDTGSDLTWVPCGNLTFDCIDCDDFRSSSSSSSFRVNSAFSPSYSSSALRDSCLSQFCSNVHSSDNPYDPCIVAGCSLATSIKGTCARPCPSFAYTYGAGGIVTGSLSRDTIRLHGTNANVIREVPRFTFGCVGSTYHEPIGIAGFGRGPLSIPSQLGFLHKGFSHCFLGFKYANNPNFSSPLVVGDAALSSKETMQYTPMLQSSMYPNYYYTGLEGVTVGNADRIQVPTILREFDSQGNGGFLIDSGTTYTHFPDPLFTQILTAIQLEMTSYARANDMESRTGFHLCYKVPVFPNEEHAPVFPPITFHFLNNVSLTLPSSNCFYAMSAPLNSTVVKCLLFRSVEDDNDEGSKNDGPAGVYGSFQQQNIQVVYDLENQRIGFQPMDCASASASQGIMAHKG
ncbi:hypothetical protein MLD38_037309 [Melastoma candidum]|uniref:Uncharacterized protein n=1 Tax=Melastoma candidum TaxID=119954 RepID=A0ACB9LMX0_9MYRT|nr:hypothetical protein MLD38_037309 [Melastoma candidum]